MTSHLFVAVSGDTTTASAKCIYAYRFGEARLTGKQENPANNDL